MLVVHALWSPLAGFCFWAEDSTRVTALVSQPPGRGQPVLPPIVAHPFAVTAGLVAAVLSPEGARPAEGASDGQLTLMLPTNSWGPIPSPRARIEAEGRPTRTEQLRPWLVPVVRLPAQAAVDLLLDRPGPAGTDDNPVITGGAWDGLAAVADTAVDLVASGRALPGIVDPAGGRTQARWLPVPTAAHGRRIRSLVAAIPPLCRAETDPAGNTAPPLSEVLLTGALAAMVDAIVRSAVADWPRVTPGRAPGPEVLPVEEAFLAALTGADARLAADPTETFKLQSVLDDWRRTGLPEAGPLRSGFRVTPAGADGPRRVEFLLESADDSDPLPAGGAGMLLPPWWRSPAARLGLRLRARPRLDDGSDRNPYGLGLAGVCDYDYEVAVGDLTLTVAELRELAELKTPLTQVRGQWIELRPGDAERALAALTGSRSPGAGSITAADVLRIGLGLDPAPGTELPVVAVTADGWLGDLLAGDGDQRIKPHPTPASFNGSLRPYQERGLAWLWFLHRLGLGACLADDMGLGKTAQLLALLLAEREGPRGGRRCRPAPTLLVCPMSLVGNWQRESERFAPRLAVHVHHGAAREVGSAFTKAAGKADLVLTTYSLLARDRDLLARVSWGRLALDEAQNVKNPAAQASRAARSLPAATRVALTGTPVENRLRELWSLMDLLNPGLLGSEPTFRERFAIPVERYRHEEAAGTLRKLTGPFILRRLKTDRSIIADLPDKIEMNVLCNLTREQADLYQGVVEEMLARIEQAAKGIERMGIISAAMIKLKQVCNHPAHLLADGSPLGGARSGKLARLDEILEEINAAGERALCFTQFAEMGHLLQGHFRGRLGIDVPFLHGGVPKRGRDQMVAAFQSDGGPPLLLLSLKAGGVGLNLTAANHVIHFDRWWNPAVEDQATDRAFRIGQRRNVQVRKFVCVGTVEERIDRMIEEKRDLAQRTIGAGEAWISDLSVVQLRELVALSDDAVAEA